MAGKPSRDKGKRGELELCHIISEALGCEVRRTPHSGAGVEKGDLSFIPGLYVEAKRQERLNLNAAISQMEEQCPEDKLGVLVYRKSREPWRVVLRLSDFLPLWRMWMESGGG